MSAEVEFDVDRGLDVLAVPTEAVAVEEGHDVCYVAGVDGLERRAVTLGRSNRNFLEVKKGLAEGDQVILRPEKIDDLSSLVVHSEKGDATEGDSSTEATASSASPVTVE
jgi:multidrug efflux pump subunit AcrA (membrane-fusion protein)